MNRADHTYTNTSGFLAYLAKMGAASIHTNGERVTKCLVDALVTSISSSLPEPEPSKRMTQRQRLLSRQSPTLLAQRLRYRRLLAAHAIDDQSIESRLFILRRTV